LGLTEFSIKNDIPIIGINAGKLGFLTEFEMYETSSAVDMLLNGLLVEDNRSTMQITLNGVTCTALNDVVVQRVFSEERNTVIGVEVSVDGSSVENVLGDGLIVCTPTGSTAYSLSSGGAILAPGINAFSITPISAHSLVHRPIIYSADQLCDISLRLGEKAIVFYDGKFVGYLKQGDTLSVKKNDVQMRFLRKQDSNFYKILRNKMTGNTVGGKNG
jgi:NAD+ kinase